jgi:two-component system, OmpR family, phosphate regulon sensor histidine kinase PhoR
MLELITIGLGVGLLWTAKKLYDHRRAARALHQAIQQQRSFLRDEIPGAGGAQWEQLCADLNELIAEIARLQKLRSGQLAQLEATLGSLEEAVLIVDGENHILLANKALQEIFPRARNILNQRLELVLHSSTFLNYVDAVRTHAAQPQREMEFSDGNSTVWVEVTGTLIPQLDGQRDAWALFVLHDITNLKKLEVVRKDFVANVSHELRTPLSVIKGYVETLVDSHQEMPIDDRDRFLRTIQRHTERLNSLLEDLLTLSRLESINPGLRRESTDLSGLIAGVVDDYRARPTAAEHHLSFAIDASVGTLLIDPLKITQVLENLIDNALKYTSKGSHIEVRAVLKNNDVEVSVADDGPGIPEGDVPHIFERFYRVDKGRSREKGGTGLGLSIVKHIVQLHHGRAWVESTVGKGTTFFFSLPMRANGSGA